MRSLYYHLIDYKEVHPIRFFVILMGIIVLFILLVYVLNKILSKYKNATNKKNIL